MITEHEGGEGEDDQMWELHIGRGGWAAYSMLFLVRPTPSRLKKEWSMGRPTPSRPKKEWSVALPHTRKTQENPTAKCCATKGKISGVTTAWRPYLRIAEQVHHRTASARARSKF